MFDTTSKHPRSDTVKRRVGWLDRQRRVCKLCNSGRLSEHSVRVPFRAMGIAQRFESPVGGQIGQHHEVKSFGSSAPGYRRRCRDHRDGRANRGHCAEEEPEAPKPQPPPQPRRRPHPRHRRHRHRQWSRRNRPRASDPDQAVLTHGDSAAGADGHPWHNWGRARSDPTLYNSPSRTVIGKHSAQSLCTAAWGRALGSGHGGRVGAGVRSADHADAQRARRDRRPVRVVAWRLPPISVRRRPMTHSSPSPCRTRLGPTRWSAGRASGGACRCAGGPATNGRSSRCSEGRCQRLRSRSARLPRPARPGVLRITAPAAGTVGTARRGHRGRPDPQLYPASRPSRRSCRSTCRTGVDTERVADDLQRQPAGGGRLHWQGDHHRDLRVHRIRPSRPRHVRHHIRAAEVHPHPGRRPTG